MYIKVILKFSNSKKLIKDLDFFYHSTGVFLFLGDLLKKWSATARVNI